MYSAPPLSLDQRDFHDRVYRGEILKLDTIPSMATLVSYVQSFLEEAFHPFSPPEIHRHYNHQQQVELFTAREKAFAQAAETKKLWQQVFEEVGLAPDRLARDRLHLRFQPHQDPDADIPRARATATIAFHRDTWGSNLYAQTNWWAPIYPITEGRTFAMFPSLWRTPVKNTSADFDMQAVLERSKTAGRHAVDADEAIPHLAEDIDSLLGIPVVIEPGSVIAFSSAHAHAGVPNHTGVTRISLETRTIWIDDLREGRSAPNVDGRAPWMTPGLFRRVSDEKPLHELLGMNRIEPFHGFPAAVDARR